MALPGEMSEWIFPPPRSRGDLRSETVRGWLLRAEERAGVEHMEGWGFHGLRRRWVTKRKHLPRADVADAGGWADEATLDRYEQPDPDTKQQVMMAGRKWRLEGKG